MEVAVEMVGVHRGHAGIVHVAPAVPDAVAFVHPNVAHLRGQKILQRGLPNVAGVHLVVDGKGFGLIAAVLNHVHARLLLRRKIKLQIIVAKKLAPGFWRRR